MEACNQKLVHIDQFRVINRIHIRHRSVLVEQALVINPSGTVEGFLLGGLIGDDDMCAWVYLAPTDYELSQWL